ncbi:uncharacterized protein PRCAT00001372001 [Priceomyces carsonii]|uniref:uncharacterized protein n=1 Tax=Priceomyces carsonii TaxID=28549 RepID=UPI002ED7B30B|nr:unnamed protein product [Priceomyces carsonii]
MQASECKKPIKRRVTSNNKLTAEELTKKILFLLIENLISFDKIENPFFKNFLSHSVNDNTSFLPDAELLLHLTTEIYNDYQEYFKNYFATQPNIKISISCHKWSPSYEFNPYMFINVHYINESYRLCELCLSFFEFNSTNLSNFLIRDTVLKNFKNKVNFITTNYKFDDNSLDILKFVTNEDKIKNKILPCVPEFLNLSMKEFLVDLEKALAPSQPNLNHIDVNSSSKDTISILIGNFLGQLYSRIKNLSLRDILPLPNDKDNEQFDILNSTAKRNEMSYSLKFLRSVLFYKSQIIETSEKNQLDIVGDFEWDLIKFIVEFSSRFEDIIIGSYSNNGPVSHMILKWMKILIIHVTSFSKHPSIGEKKVDIPIANILKRLTSFHNDLENKFDLVLSSYLHPSTKRYLKDNHISRVNSMVELLNTESNSFNVDEFDSTNMDDIIMKTFDCSGKATKECYNYETSATSEIKYSRMSKYFSKESGSHILQFWNKNHQKYSTLSSLSKQTLSIPLSADRNFGACKSAFHELKRASYSNHCPLDIEAVYFLHKLSKTYDLQSFNPKNFDLDIEDYRMDNSEYINVDEESGIYDDLRLNDTSDYIELAKRSKR